MGPIFFGGIKLDAQKIVHEVWIGVIIIRHPFVEWLFQLYLGGDFKHFLFSSLFGEMIQFD